VKIARQEIVISFEIDQSIVLTCGNAIKNVQRKLGGRILSINAPDDAPPSMPRVILKLKDTILNIGLDRIQITTIPPSHVSDNIEKTSKFTIQRIEPFLTELLPVIPKYFWSGVITEIEFHENPMKSNSADEAAIPIFDKLINIDRKNKELSAFQLQYGIKDDLCFITYTISAFEGRQIEFKMPPKPGYFRIEPSEYLLMECGIRILLDINNKPNKHNENPIKDIENILAKQNSLVSNIVEDINLKGVLS
jgi:hypothetical protein